MKKIPCQCPPCQTLAMIAITLASEGLVNEAEMIAAEITWIDQPADTSEGYTDTWSRPIPPSDSVFN